MKGITSNASIVILAAASLVSVAAGATWDEAIDGGGDSGQLIGTAQVPTGVGPLSQITGVIPGPDDIDMYRLYIPNPGVFAAVSTGGLPFGPPKMFLFDASGLGVAGYDDSTNGGTALSGTFVTSPGVYNLALSGFSYPEDSLNQPIWSITGLTDVERAPDGIGAANLLAGWSPSIVPFSPHGYTITLTGAAYVPEPAGALVLLLGFAGVVRRRRRDRQEAA